MTNKAQLNIEYLPVNQLTPYERNARKHQAPDVDAIVASIQEFGFDDPIGVWGEKNLIVEGHGRLLAAKKLGLDTVPVIRLDHLTDEQRRAYALAHNRTAELSEWDEVAKDLELAGITEIDMSLFGFDTGDDYTVVEDDYDKPAPEEPKSRPGDLYQLGRHRLYCGDATMLGDVERLTGGVQMDLLLTDPPYNVDYHGGTGLTIENDNMPDADFRRFLADSFSNAKSVMKPGAAFHIWHADSEGYNFRGACRDAGLLVRQCLIWEKNSLVLGRQDFQWKHEPCLYGENPPPLFDQEEYLTEDNHVALYGWRDGGRHYFYKNRRQTTILKFDRPTKSKEHPTMKPVLLFNYQMECNTKPGETVLDLFAGSGTTIIAAEQNGRVAYCLEKDPRYVDVIIDRWQEFTGKTAELLNGK